MNEKLIELLKNEDFCVKFFDTLEDMTGLGALLEANGITVTEDEIRELVKIAKAQIAKADGVELDEADLDDVSGGVILWVVAGVASGIFFGYQVYKAKKGLNGLVCKVK